MINISMVNVKKEDILLNISSFQLYNYANFSIIASAICCVEAAPF